MTGNPLLSIDYTSMQEIPDCEKFVFVNPYSELGRIVQKRPDLFQDARVELFDETVRMYYVKRADLMMLLDGYPEPKRSKLMTPQPHA